MPHPIRRLVLFGDELSIRQLTSFCRGAEVVALVGAAIRPHFFEDMKALAQELGVPFLIQPKQKEIEAHQDFLAQLRTLQPDGVMSNNYSMRLPEDVLRLIGQNVFNFHYALLPRHRGANPIEWAIIHGDSEMGVSVHCMDADFDTGPLIASVPVPIEPDDTGFELSKRAFVASFDLIRTVVPHLIAGTWQAVAQAETRATYNTRIPKEGLKLDLQTMDDETLYNTVRALARPFVGCYLETTVGRQRVDEFLTRAQIKALRAQYSEAL